LFHVRSNQDKNVCAGSPDFQRRQTVPRTDEIVNAKTELLEIVGAGHAPCGFAGGLDCGQKKSDKHADDGNDDQEFDERESEAAILPILRIYPPPQLPRVPKLTFADLIVFSLLKKIVKVLLFLF
jgi:hypothetical protein